MCIERGLSNKQKDLKRRSQVPLRQRHRNYRNDTATITATSPNTRDEYEGDQAARPISSDQSLFPLLTTQQIQMTQ